MNIPPHLKMSWRNHFSARPDALQVRRLHAGTANLAQDALQRYITEVDGVVVGSVAEVVVAVVDVGLAVCLALRRFTCLITKVFLHLEICLRPSTPRVVPKNDVIGIGTVNKKDFITYRRVNSCDLLLYSLPITSHKSLR